MLSPSSSSSGDGCLAQVKTASTTTKAKTFGTCSCRVLATTGECSSTSTFGAGKVDSTNSSSRGSFRSLEHGEIFCLFCLPCYSSLQDMLSEFS